MARSAPPQRSRDNSLGPPFSRRATKATAPRLPGRNVNQVRKRLAAGGRWIRTSGSWSRRVKPSSETGLLSRKRERTSWGTEGSNPSPSSLQRRVRTKRTHRRTISAGNAVPTGDRWFESISLQRKVCELSVRLLSRPEGDVRGIGFQTVRTYIAIGNSEAVAKCPSPRPSPRIPGRTGERAYETRLGITGRLAARGGRGRIGAIAHCR